MAAKTGVAPPPPGVTPDFDISNAHLKTANIVTISIGLFLSTSCLIMRIYTKTRLMRRFWLDDIFLLAAWVFSTATQAHIIWGLSWSGYGIHIWNFTPELMSTYQRTVFAGTALYIPTLAFAKLAMLMFYYVLLRTTTAWRYTIYGIAFVISGYSIGLFMALVFGCSPIARSWDLRVTGTCVNRTAIFLAMAVANTTSDVILITIPIPIVWQLTLPLLQRLGVIGMFGIGSMTIVISVIRLATLMPLLNSPDQTYGIALAILFVDIEANLLIICPSLPYLRQFLRYHSSQWGSDLPSPGGSGSKRSSESSGKPRKPGLSQLQDDIQRALTIENIPSSIQDVELQAVNEPAPIDA